MKMVQRKLNGIQASSASSESSLERADLKKKMKKSGSFKRPELDRSRASATMRKRRRQIEQPGNRKPPPASLNDSSCTPKKQSPIKDDTPTTTPNYMRSTSSSDARKDRSQLTPHAFPDAKTPSIRRNLMNSKTNHNDDDTAPERTSSLRILTKTPSFKPTRSSSIILSQNLEAHKATCSSTLKSHKFPDYLTLNPGATESQGTSTIKVCPYAYCSLNGHHHEPLPPLKTFISARRRLLKAQRSVKLGCLYPRRAKPARDITKQQVEAAEQTPVEHGLHPLTEQVSSGFFTEIYTKQGLNTYQNNLEIKDITFLDNDASSSSAAADADAATDDSTAPKPDFLTLLYELEEEESTPSIQSEVEEEDPQASDMDWEESLQSAAYTFAGAASQIQIYPVIDLEKANSSLDNALLDEVFSKSDESVGGNFRDNHLLDEISNLEYEDVAAAQQGWNQNLEDHSENLNYMPENTNKILKSSVGTQTDGEDFRDMSGNSDQVFKRSIGTQTDIEDDLSEACCFSNEDEGNKTVVSDSVLPDQGQDCSLGIQSISSSEDLESFENKNDETTEVVQPISLEDRAGNADQTIHNTQVSHTEDASDTRIKLKPVGIGLDEEPAVCSIIKGTIKSVADDNEIMGFHPRAPNFLPVEPHPDAEKVDLRHLMLDENKNTEDWMLDRALQQAVTKLGPARKRKVALLVEAFETVLPIPKHGPHVSHTSTVFPHVRQIQACS